MAALIALTVALGTSVQKAKAATVAYWRFEGDGVTSPTDGAFLRDTNGRTMVTTDGILAVDASGNGNHLLTWDNTAAAGHVYRPTVAPTSALQSGQPNNWSIQNAGGAPSSFTWSEQTSPTGIDLQTWAPATWTIEASVMKTVMGGWRTIVGRDGNDVDIDEAGLAPFYLQSMGGDIGQTAFNDVDHVRVQIVDAAGINHSAVDPAVLPANQWAHFAASSDGTMLRLYKDLLDGLGYQLVAETDMTATSTNTALVAPGQYSDDGANWGWSVGRGRYGTNDASNANHVDRWLGFIDEVRFSDQALTPAQLLFRPEFDLAVIVNKNTGAVALRNISSEAITIDYYEISSPDPDGPGGTPGGALSVAGWNSLSDQGVDAGQSADFNNSGGPVDAADLTAWRGAFGTTAAADADGDGDSDGADFLTWQRQLGQTGGDGDSWDESGGVTNQVLSELFLNGTTTLAPGAQLSLGNAFNPAVFGAGVNGNLSFRYGIQGSGTLSAGGVTYVTTGPVTPVPEPTALVVGIFGAVVLYRLRPTRRG